MTADTYTLRSSISTSYMRTKLWKGSLLAVAGGLLIVFGGVFVPLDNLRVWGIPLFIGGFGLITLGLLPYRKLKRLEINPFEIVIDEKGMLLQQNKKPLYYIPKELVDKISYFEEGNEYGVAVALKRGREAKIHIYSQAGKKLIELNYSFDRQSLHIQWFSKRSSQELKESFYEF